MEERERILKLLEEGKITAEEATKLLEALGEPFRFTQRGPGSDLGKRIARKVELSLKDLPDMIERCVPFMDTGEEKELKFDPRERFTVKAVAGDVKITGDDEQSIRIKLQGGHKVAETEDELLIKTMSGDIDIEVPKSQEVELKAAAGDVSASNLASELSIRCGGGDLKLKNISGRLTTAVGGGDVRGKDISAELDIRVGGGDIDLDLSACRGVGRIELGGGDINLTIPEKANVELTIHKPKYGDISSDFDLEPSDEEDELKAVLGKPEAKLYVKTKHGDITLRKRSK
ncbi:hypothetical protein CEE36_07220 [candidate division TA06 bacterium B3_TA06]|uniref:Uncharacterized protein n=1 Tax=candidate division TA06 bacterium B3_TA06 TaxID=2012487 RepID=A0A532V646_UNCT6|nr:MAG: hypothetical protein CEE36_07220 [candidate division TA06 bacterium B3_TA06]